MTDTACLYESIPQTVEAIQWDGAHGTEQAIRRFAPGKTRRRPVVGPLLLLAGKDGAQEWVPVPVGHWIVHLPGDLSDIWPVDPDYFAAKYQPAK